MVASYSLLKLVIDREKNISKFHKAAKSVVVFFRKHKACRLLRPCSILGAAGQSNASPQQSDDDDVDKGSAFGPFSCRFDSAFGELPESRRRPLVCVSGILSLLLVVIRLGFYPFRRLVV